MRIITSGKLSYVFLAWNLALACIPYVISEWLTKHPHLLERKIKLILVVFVWMLFMPNSFYILTDLFHLDNMGYGHPWFDLTLILSFAWSGLLLGIASIRKMEILVKKSKGKLISVLIVCAVMWLNAFGVYIGRFLRYNSWDIITNPFSLFGEVTDILFNPYDYRYVWGMSICFAFFIIILYYSSKKITDTD